MAKIQLTERDLAILSSAVLVGTEAIRIVERLERAEYVRANKVLEAIGAKWNRGLQAHAFPAGTDAGTRIDEVLVAGEVERNPLGFFATPPEIVERLIDAAGVEPHHRVLEPSAGDGTIALGLWKRGVRDLHLVELDEPRCVILRTHDYTVTHGDFMQLHLGRFDRVVMNPPFARQQDIAHVRRAYGLLAPRGRLVSVMAAGVGFRLDRAAREFRELVERCGRLEPLPDDAFRASGTKVRTVMVVLDAE